MLTLCFAVYTTILVNGIPSTFSQVSCSEASSTKIVQAVLSCSRKAPACEVITVGNIVRIELTSS